MDFWRIVRLLRARRWLLVTIVLVTAALILIATALQASHREVTTEAKLGLQQEPQPTGPNAAPTDPNKAVNTLVTQMTMNSTVVQETTRLLKLSEKERAKEVRRILEQSGAFATSDLEVEENVAKRIATGELRPIQKAGEIKALKDRLRVSNIEALAIAKDSGGGFAQEGVPQAPGAVSELVRKLKVEAIPSLDTSDNNPKFSNSVRIVGTFPREAEANLYVNMFCLAFMDWYRRTTNNDSNRRILAWQEALAGHKSDLIRARDEEARLRRNPDATGPEGLQTLILNNEEKSQRLRESWASADATIKSVSRQLAQTEPVITVRLPLGEKVNVQQMELELTRAEAELQKLEAITNEGPNALVANPAEAQRKAVTILRKAVNNARRQPNTRTEMNPEYQRLIGQLNTAQAERASAAEQFKEAEARLVELKQRQKILPTLTGRLADVADEIKQLQTQIAELKTQIAAEKKAQISNSKAGTISIISSAIPQPGLDGWGRRARLLAVGIFLSLLAGVLFVVLMDAVDNSIRDTSDVEKLLQLPIAGVIPAQLPDPTRAPRIAYLDPLSPVSEAYRLLRTDILFTQTEHPFQSLLGIGVKPGQGTTTTICNLAITLAQAGKKVILVDADLRRPRLHEVFKLGNEHGLTSVLGAQCLLEDALQPTEVPNLMLLSAGPTTSRPSELLGSPEMQELHETLKEAADFVLFDSPSAITFADASILASFLDASIIVIRANEVPRKAEQDVRAQLDRARANIIGVVLNGMHPDRVDSSHYHGHYYPTVRGKKGQLALPPKGNDGPRSLPGGDDDQGGADGGSPSFRVASNRLWRDEDEEEMFEEAEPLSAARRKATSAPEVEDEGDDDEAEEPFEEPVLPGTSVAPPPAADSVPVALTHEAAPEPVVEAPAPEPPRFEAPAPEPAPEEPAAALPPPLPVAPTPREETVEPEEDDWWEEEVVSSRPRRIGLLDRWRERKYAKLAARTAAKEVADAAREAEASFASDISLEEVLPAVMPGAPEKAKRRGGLWGALTRRG